MDQPLAVSEAFEPDYCKASMTSLMRSLDLTPYQHGPVMTPAWMYNLSPALARHVTPPEDVIVERGADGSLFMAATDEVFSMSNREHLAAAYRIFEAIDPLHDTVPFNGRLRRS